MIKKIKKLIAKFLIRLEKSRIKFLKDYAEAIKDKY